MSTCSISYGTLNTSANKNSKDRECVVRIEKFNTNIIYQENSYACKRQKKKINSHNKTFLDFFKAVHKTTEELISVTRKYLVSNRKVF